MTENHGMCCEALLGWCTNMLGPTSVLYNVMRPLSVAWCGKWRRTYPMLRWE